MLGILELEVEANIYAKGRYLNATWEKGKKVRQIFWKNADNISAVLENVEQMEQQMDLFHTIVNAFNPTSLALAGLVKQSSRYRDSYNNAVKKWPVLVIRANRCIFASRFCKNFSATYSASVYDPDYYRFLGAMYVFTEKYNLFSSELAPFISSITNAIQSIDCDVRHIVETFKRDIPLLQGMTEETNRPEWFPAELWELRGSILRNYSEFKASNHSLLLLASEIVYTETVDNLATCLVLSKVEPMYDEFTKKFREQAQDIAARMVSATVMDVEANCQQLPSTAIPFFRKHKPCIFAVLSFVNDLYILNNHLEDTQFTESFGANSVFSAPKQHLRNAFTRITGVIPPLEMLYLQKSRLEALASNEGITKAFSLVRKRWPTITLDNFTVFRDQVENERAKWVKYLENMRTLVTTSPLGEDHQTSSKIQKLGLEVRNMLEEIKGNLTTISDSISSKAWVKGTSIDAYKVGLDTTSRNAYQKKFRKFFAKISAQAELTIRTIDDLLGDTQHLNSAADSSKDTKSSTKLSTPQEQPTPQEHNPTDPVATPNTPAPKSKDATTIFKAMSLPQLDWLLLAPLPLLHIVAITLPILVSPPKPSLSVYRLLKWELAFLTTFTIAFVGGWVYKRYMNGDDEPMGRKPSEKTSASTRAKYMPQGHNNPLSPGVTKENQQEDNNTKSESHASKATVSSACSHHHGGLFTGSLFAIVPLLLMAVA